MSNNLVYWTSPAKGKTVFGFDLSDFEALVVSNCFMESRSKTLVGTLVFAKPGKANKPSDKDKVRLLSKLTVWEEDYEEDY